MSAHHQLTAVRDTIATILSVRHPRRLKKKARQSCPPRPPKSLTNHSIACRISSFQGSAIYIINAGRYYRIPTDAPCARRRIGNRGILMRVICEAGRDEPARWKFTVRDGVGFLTPVAPQTGKEN